MHPIVHCPFFVTRNTVQGEIQAISTMEKRSTFNRAGEDRAKSGIPIHQGIMLNQVHWFVYCACQRLMGCMVSSQSN